MNRKELYDFAKSLDQKDAPVGAILLAIDEAHQQLKYNCATLALVLEQAVELEPAFCAQPVLHKYALDYEVAAAKLNTLFLTLAVVLEQQGHKVDY